jgi:hypothetical protein
LKSLSFDQTGIPNAGASARTADRRTLASAAIAATGLSPGLEVTQDLRLAHSARLQMAFNPGAYPGQELSA